jgi:hypothetical protein
MKTNNVMIRPMGQFQVEQRTKDGMFNATALLRQWNETANAKKEIKDYLENKSTQEFLAALIEEENLNGENSPYLTSRGKYTGGTWMHPLLFIDFAMWLNPAFKVKVLKFVYDQMIQYRNDAGDAYKELGSAMSKVVEKSFMAVAMSNISKAINYIVFGEHYSLIRNDKGTEDMQRELFEMERKVSQLIFDGFLKSYDEIMNYLRKKWREKYTPAILQ